MDDPMFGSVTYAAVSMQVGSLPVGIFDVSGYKVSYPKARKSNEFITGRKMPVIKLRGLDGDKMPLDFKGKTSVVNFWFIGCAPCKKEIPYLNELVNTILTDTVQFVAIALDREDEVVAFVEKTPFQFKQLVDGRDVARALDIRSYPTTLIVDATGRIVKTWQGSTPFTGLQIFEFLSHKTNRVQLETSE
jgi:thiol-disulfide isomerase/thioredoxin